MTVSLLGQPKLKKISTLDLRPPEKAMDEWELDTLRFVNSVRADLEMLPLTTLPRGTRGRSHDCVIARALSEGEYMGVANGAHIGVFKRDHGVVIDVPTPPHVAEFISRFDERHYPKLEA